MDEQSVRAAAEDHAAATVAGNLRTAGAYLTPEAIAQAGGVMKAMPENLSAGSIARVDQTAEEFEVDITYSGDGGSTTVRSRWAERDGKPMITGLEVV